MVWQVVRPADGGLRTYLTHLLPELRREGVGVVSVGPWRPDPASEGHIQLEVGDGLSPFQDRRALRYLEQFARERKPDLVHAHGAKAALLARLTFRGSLPSLYSLHGLPRRALLNKLAERALSPWTAMYLAPTQAVARELSLRWGVDASRIRVSPYGPSPERIDRLLALGSAPRSRAPLHVAVLARLVPDKGLDLLLRAVKRVWLSSQAPSFKVSLAGRGPMERQLESMIEDLDLGGVVFLRGHLGEREVDELLLESDVCLLPSLKEALGISAIEAMAAGIAVIVSDAGGLPEVVSYGRAGVIFRAGDERDLAEKLLAVLSDQSMRQRLRQRARQRASSCFCLRSHVDTLRKTYLELIQGA